MIKNVKETGILRKKTFDPNKIAGSYDSSSESDDDENFSSVVRRKKSSDIRSLMGKGDIEEIFYETTKL